MPPVLRMPRPQHRQVSFLQRAYDRERGRRKRARRARSSARWQNLRKLAKQRDGRRCTSYGSTDRLEVHHVVPIEDGGAEFDLDNLITLCSSCHHDRHRGDGSTTGQELSHPHLGLREENSRGNHAELKWCCGCLEWHPLDAFRPSETFNGGGRAGGYCREYRSAAVRRWRDRNQDAVEEYNAARRIGPRELECVDCGASFTAGARGPASDRCTDCRRQRKIEQRRPLRA